MLSGQMGDLRSLGVFGVLGVVSDVFDCGENSPENFLFSVFDTNFSYFNFILIFLFFCLEFSPLFLKKINLLQNMLQSI